MSFKILYAEDEPFLSRIVYDNLISKGYEVSTAADGEAGLKLYKSVNPDLCIIDIMMPLKDGYNLVEDIRQLGRNIPIIFVSAKSLDEDVVKGFKSGGNDYLRKPFSMVELLVRVDSLLTRFNQAQSHTETALWYEFGNSKLDTVNQQLKTPDKVYDLSYKEVMLLEMLLKNKNMVLERHDALIKIWGDDSVYNTNSMNVFMTHLRKMLKDDPEVQILSLRNLGYKIVC